MKRNRLATRRLNVESLEDRSLMTAGFLDPSFDRDGVVTTNVGALEYAHDLAVYPVGVPNAGKIVAVGSAAPVSGSNSLDCALVRYNPDGTLDASFGTGGIVTKSLVNSEDQGMDVALVGNKIYVGGYAYGGAGSGFDFVLARFNADGTPDTTFGKRGSTQTDLGDRGDFGMTMAVQADGKILLAGTSGGMFAAVRYNTNGTLDSTFGNRGKVRVDVGELLQGSTDRYVDMVLAGDRIILAAASRTTAGNHVHVVQLTSSGQLDAAFGTGGKVQLGVGDQPRVALQSNGTIVLAYTDYSSSPDIRVTRLLANGVTDTAFGSGGTTTLPGLTTGTAISTAVSVDSLDRIVLGGWVPNSFGSTVNGKLFVARFTSAGALDTTFGVNGWNTTGGLADVYTSRNAFASLTLQPDGKALVVGTTADWKFVTARFDGDPALLAASLPAHAVSTSITADQVQPLLAAALTRWQAAGVDTSALSGLTIRTADLGGTTLGLASGNTIWLDDNAAGWGWFVDATPGDDSEYHRLGNQGEQNRMDLLTVVMHELGHLLGHDHDEEGVMAESLLAGVRRTGLDQDDVALADQVFGQGATIEPMRGWEPG